MDRSARQETALAYTRRMLRQGGRAKKYLGQNFLVDDDIISRIVNEGIPEQNMPLIEIGPGPGGLTRELIKLKQRLWAVELDQEKVQLLSQEFGHNLKLIHMDALRLQLQELWGNERGWLIGNLPYYITNPLLMHFLSQKDSLYGMTVMVQKEVADRMVAQPGIKDYGILSIAVQLSANVYKLFDVPPAAFLPQPKVTSTVLKLDIRSYPGFDVNEAIFLKVVKAAFSQRRKTLLNTLVAGLGLNKNEVSEILLSIGIKEKSRAEEITIIDYQQITKSYIDRKTRH